MLVKMLTSIVLCSILAISFQLTPSQERFGSVVDDAVAARQMGGGELYWDGDPSAYPGESSPCGNGNTIYPHDWCGGICGVQVRNVDKSGLLKGEKTPCGDEFLCRRTYARNLKLCF